MDEVFDDSASTELICTGGLVVPTTGAFWRKLLLVMGEGGGGGGGDGTACFPLVVRFDVGLSGARCFALSVASVAFVCVFLGFGASAEARFDVGFDRSRAVLAYSRYLSSVSSLPSALVKTCQGGSFLMYESFLGPGDAGVMLWMCNNNTRRPTADEI